MSFFDREYTSDGSLFSKVRNGDSLSFSNSAGVFCKTKSGNPAMLKAAKTSSALNCGAIILSIESAKVAPGSDVKSFSNSVLRYLYSKSKIEPIVSLTYLYLMYFISSSKLLPLLIRKPSFASVLDSVGDLKA